MRKDVLKILKEIDNRYSYYATAFTEEQCRHYANMEEDGHKLSCFVLTMHDKRKEKGFPTTYSPMILVLNTETYELVAIDSREFETYVTCDSLNDMELEPFMVWIIRHYEKLYPEYKKLVEYESTGK